MQQVWGGSWALPQIPTQNGAPAPVAASAHTCFNVRPGAPPSSPSSCSIYNTSVFKQEALKDAVTGQGCQMCKFTWEGRRECLQVVTATAHLLGKGPAC